MTVMNRPPPAGDQGFLKQLNRSAVLDAVRRQPGLSRAEIAAHTQLTKVTVGSVVQDLLNEGWLDEGELQHGGVGRPGRRLYLSEQNFVLLGAEVGVLGLRLVACSLSGRVLAQNAVSAPTGTPQDAAQQVVALLRELLNQPGIVKRRPLGLGVAVPGPVNVPGDTLLYAPNLGWQDIPFLKLLEPLLPDLPGVRLLENEANAAAFGEAYLRPSGTPELLAYLSLGTGVGAGLAAGAPSLHLLRGAQGLAGEVGHTIIQPGGLYCHCGQRGCVETLLSGWAIRAALGVNPLEPLDTALMPRLREAAVQVALHRAGEALGTLLINLHHTLNPSDIVIGGALARLGGPLLNTALDMFHARQGQRFHTARPVNVEVKPSSLFLPALGVAAQVLAHAIGTAEVSA